MTGVRRHPAGRAFTLIELMASVVILGAIGTVSASVILQSLDSYADTATAAQLQTDASAALERIARAIQSIGLDPDEASLCPHATKTKSNSIEWLDASNRQYELTSSGSNVTLKEADGPAVVMLSNVTNFRVRTYDKSNALLSDNLNHSQSHNIRRVGLEVTTQQNGRSMTLRTKVFIRCMMAEGT